MSVGNLIGAVIGATIGFFVGGIGGAIKGAAIGSAIGGAALPPDLPTTYGPRLSDLKVQQSEYGAALPLVYGTAALQGTVIWSKDIEEVKTETETGGGLSEPEQTTVSYSYYGTFAVAVADGPIKGFLRIWAGQEKRLIYDGVSLEGGEVRFYLGDETQLPDPLIQADQGIAPAYRGTAYAVFERFPLEKDGNQLPYLTFEISTGDDGGTCGVDYVTINGGRLYDRPPVKLGNMGDLTPAFSERFTTADNDGNVYVVARNANEDWFLKRVSSRAPIQEAVLPLGPEFNGILQCRIAYNPDANVIGVLQQHTKNSSIVDCASFTVLAYEEQDRAKCDIAYISSESRFRFLNSQSFGDSTGHPDSYGITQVFGSGFLIDCGPRGIAVGLDTGLLFGMTATYLNGEKLTSLSVQFYDERRDRLVGLSGSSLAPYCGYYEFETGETVIPAQGVMARGNPVYSPVIDRYFWTGLGLNVMNPADLSPESFADECQLLSGAPLYYDKDTLVQQAGFYYIAVPLPGVRNQIAVVMNYPNSDIFLFPLGASGAGVTLASVVADLSDRAGLEVNRYDVARLESDIVDGYVIARQMQVRGAIDVLRAAYYFDAVESQGVIKFVKRGGQAVAVIPDEDLAAHEPGSEAPDPLLTVRKMEVELPRAFSVKYMLAATDYSAATKQARRLIGASGDEKTLEVPLVLTDAKAKEVAEVNLHAEWGERLSYQFALPRKYAYLEPTDLIIVKSHLMRLTMVKATPRGILQCEAVSDESAYYAPNVVVTETPGSGGMVSRPGVTLLELF